MALAAGRYRTGDGDGTLDVLVHREGVAAKVGHDLRLRVGRWRATVVIGDVSEVELKADSSTLAIVEASGGVKSLSDGDRDDVLGNIDKKVLRGEPIEFGSSSVSIEGTRLDVSGELTIGEHSAPVAANLAVDGDRVTGSIALVQSDFGIKPFRGLMGALKVRDEVVIEIDARLDAHD